MGDSNLQNLSKPVKIAAFDFDDTLITATAGKFNRNANSWTWWDKSVPGKLRDLHSKGYLLAIISNQGAISLKDDPKKLQTDSLSLKNFKDQLSSVLRQLDLPMSVYAATGQDNYRKPRTGMWRELLEDYDLEGDDLVDHDGSFFVGDAAGRDKTAKRGKDHSCSDRDLAANIRIAFKTPEECFRDESPESFIRLFEPNDNLSDLVPITETHFEKKNELELIIFCGSPGAGKSSFYWDVLKPRGYERVNQDILKTRDRCLKVARDHLTARESVVVDNTNASVETRAHWIKLARDFKIPIRCIRFTAPTRLCEHNDAVRALNSQDTNPENRTMLPGIAFKSYMQRFQPPTLAEGFQDLTDIHFRFKGTPAQRAIWKKYWVSKFST